VKCPLTLKANDDDVPICCKLGIDRKGRVKASVVTFMVDKRNELSFHLPPSRTIHVGKDGIDCHERYVLPEWRARFCLRATCNVAFDFDCRTRHRTSPSTLPVARVSFPTPDFACRMRHRTSPSTSHVARVSLSYGNLPKLAVLKNTHGLYSRVTLCH
jgi:hypothetical protein